MSSTDTAGTPNAPHPRHDLDPLLLHGVRFSVLAIAVTAGETAFSYVCDELQVSKSVLSKQLTILEEAGYVRVSKVAHGRQVRTWIHATGKGRAAFDRHRTALEAIAGGTWPGSFVRPPDERSG